MSGAQLKQWAVGAAAVLHHAADEEIPAEWDEALWLQLCDSYGANPACGFTWEQFMLLFRTYHATVEAHEQLNEWYDAFVYEGVCASLEQMGDDEASGGREA